MTSTATTGGRFVRPRYDDGTFDAALPLEDLLLERVLGPEPGRLVVGGERGSGLTTTLRWAAGLARERGFVVVLPTDLAPDGDLTAGAWAALAGGEGVLLIDGSVGVAPLRDGAEVAGAGRLAACELLRRADPERLRVLAGARSVAVGPATCDRALGIDDPFGALLSTVLIARDGLERELEARARARELDAGARERDAREPRTSELGGGGGAHEGRALARGRTANVVRLAPWTWDDVLELLARDEALRPHRARVLAALRGLPGAADLVARPRVARLLIDAAAALGTDEPVTIGRLYANVLDALEPRTLEALRALRSDTTLGIAQALAWVAEAAPPRLELEPDDQEGIERATRAHLRFDAEGPVEPGAELSALFELGPRLDALLARGGLGPVRALCAAPGAQDLSARLALPGLHHLLGAGDAMRAVTRGEVPAAVPDTWRPFLPELVTDELRRALRRWLTDGAEAARATWSYLARPRAHDGAPVDDAPDPSTQRGGEATPETAWDLHDAAMRRGGETTPEAASERPRRLPRPASRSAGPDAGLLAAVTRARQERLAEDARLEALRRDVARAFDDPALMALQAARDAQLDEALRAFRRVAPLLVGHAPVRSYFDGVVEAGERAGVPRPQALQVALESAAVSAVGGDAVARRRADDARRDAAVRDLVAFAAPLLPLERGDGELPRAIIAQGVASGLGLPAAVRVVAELARLTRTSLVDADARDRDAPDPEARDPDAPDPGARDPEARDPDAHDRDAHDPDAHDPDAHDRDAHDRDAHDRDAPDPDAPDRGARDPEARDPDDAAATRRADERRHAPAATILWACGEAPPADRPGLVLDGANLEGVVVPGARWRGALLGKARLARARLAGADLSSATALGTDLRGADLDGADLAGLVAEGADLRGARLRGAWALGARLEACDLTGADLQGARLRRASLIGDALAGASLAGADLHGARIAPRGAERVADSNTTLLDLAGADLGDTCLDAARLVRLDLRRATFRPRSLVRARLELSGLSRLDLDGLRADGVKLIGCELSRATLRGASLGEALIVDCRAHDARFDGADLRGARFLRARFQAGSTRCGLLVGEPALEGSMTGYYVEGTTDEAWASPDALVKASFAGCDLRGAVFESTNLFRVDLRGARLDAGLREEARDQGAFLD